MAWIGTALSSKVAGQFRKTAFQGRLLTPALVNSGSVLCGAHPPRTRRPWKAVLRPFCNVRVSKKTLVLIIPLLMIAPVHAVDELARRATWQQPTAEQVKAQVDQWLAGRQIDPTTQAKLDVLWLQPDGPADPTLLDTLASTLELVDGSARELVVLCRRKWSPGPPARFQVLSDEQTADLVRNNLRLLYGRWLTGQQLYNEALEQLQSLEPDDVVDPASLLFYQGAVYHRLLNKDKALATIAQLLENEQTIPQRYATLARLMEADLGPLKTDSLDEIARLMDSIHVRLGHGRAGRRVRQEEDDVVAKLDKLIKKLEEQAQQSQSSGGAMGRLQPSQPMQDSNPAGGTGPGNVDPKRLADKQNWGNLPPKDRQEALQQLGKDYPSYYREVIEEYFRKLARDDAAGQP